ncbi:hypothetical protein GV829_10445 [Sphingomonas lacunae]|uniref:EF-hand domain-containing protein n=1 Tax=Sphingomonas lacunae TaxID=2698828 RepID=A0A6M4AXR3_9SPHN|nr:hypothetical protein [Sphingomonas lacunae]QJQ32809.1 hypothetical protein GV829_10445 [Sphingomonas lacunae]
MAKSLIGAGAAILLLLGGWFAWMGLSSNSEAVAIAAPPPDATLPVADGAEVGAPPPEPPRAREASREERRFARYDRNRDGIVTRVEMLSTRTNAFKRLDKDGNNLLSFEEWAVATSDRFAGADADRSGGLNAAEFATTAPRRRPQAQAQARCACDEDGEGQRGSGRR